MANDKRFVRNAFAAIAPRYDLMNALLSFGAERGWRRRAVSLVDPRPGERILDLCAGTLTLSRDLSARAGGKAFIFSADFCLEMLSLGQRRLAGSERQTVLPLCGDAEALPLSKDRFDAAAVAYGIRNLSRIPQAIEELHRVLRPGARLVILDFLRPRLFGIAPLYRFYLKRILPAAGGLLTGSRSAYRHLADSIEAFMEPEELLSHLEKAGFAPEKVRALTFGVAGLVRAWKPG